MAKTVRKLDTDAIGDPNSHLLGDLEQWDAAVIRSAAYFTFVRMRGPSRGDRQVIVYRTLPEVLALTRDDPQTLAYALTFEGRSTCIPREHYLEAAVIWGKMYQTELKPHIFRAGEHNGWFVYNLGRTTGPWASSEQATLVGTSMNTLTPSAWKKLQGKTKVTVRNALLHLNQRLIEQGRAPIIPPGED